MVIAPDTGIFILMEHVFVSHLTENDWFLQRHKNQCVNVSKIHDYNGNAIAITLPAMFVHTDCDTVSYFYQKYKKAIFEQFFKQDILAIEFLSDFREHTYLSETSGKKLKRSVQIFVYVMYVLMYVLIFYLLLSRSSHLRCSVK